jgi:hypothetical protein
MELAGRNMYIPNFTFVNELYTDIYDFLHDDLFVVYLKYKSCSEINGYVLGFMVIF